MQFNRVSRGIPALYIFITMKHGDQVEQLATPQRVLHEMVAWAGPQDHVVAPQFGGHVFHRQHRAVGNVPRHARLAVIQQLLAHG